MTHNTRYNNGKIYKIINNFNDMVYIGSTCLPLRKRIFNHKKEQRAGRTLEMGLHELAAPPTVPHSTLTGARWPSKTTTNEVSKSWRRPGDRRCTCAAKHALLHPAPAASRARCTP